MKVRGLFLKYGFWIQTSRILLGKRSKTISAPHQSESDVTDRVVSYINGYVAASQGRDSKDYSVLAMDSDKILALDWYAGYRHFEEARPMNPVTYLLKVVEEA